MTAHAQSTRNISLSSWWSSVFRTELAATHLSCANLCAFWTEGSCNAYKFDGAEVGGCQLGTVYWLEDTEAGVRIMMEENLLASLPLICAGGHHCCSRERSSEHIIISAVSVDWRWSWRWLVIERSEE